jgi:microcystin degradation protein MlrC
VRIAVGGFQHETNTFAASRAGLADFEAPDAWPGLVAGDALLDAVAGINLPIAGFVEAAQAAGHSLVPLLWCSAQPSGPVTRDAFETVAERMLTLLRAALPCDALYLDLHGAMVAEHVDDADGELLERVRALVGPDLPVVVSLDFHANVSPRMAALATALVSYRSYPHVDMAETGARAAALLGRLPCGRTPVHVLRALDFLIPLTSQCTLVEPMQGLMLVASQLESGPVLAAGFTPGFPAADVAECGPAVYVCAVDEPAAAAAAERLHNRVAAAEPDFALELASVDTAVAAARVHVDPRPLLLADTQDNPGAGGNADTMELIAALREAQLRGVVAGVICDRAAASAAHRSGCGARIVLDLGAGTGFPGSRPLHAEFEVVALGDGRFVGTGPFYRGARFELGPMALLRCEGIDIAVASRKQQAADQAMFRHLGVEPARARVLVLKSSVHFRADFGGIAARVLIVEAPGPNTADPARLRFDQLRPGVRRSPRNAYTRDRAGQVSGPDNDRT